MIRRAFRLPEFLLWASPLVLFAPVLLAGKALFWGTPLLQFVPWWTWASQTLRAGKLPLWNPLVGMGAPLAANYQSGLFYPPNWLYLLAGTVGGAPAIAWLLAALAALHLAWAAIGMARLARRLGLGPPAQVVCGLAFGCSGYLVARAGFLSLNAAAAWLPWIIASLVDWQNGIGEARQAGDRFFWPAGTRTKPLAILLALQLLAGHAQTSWYTWLLVAAWTSFWAWRGAAETGSNLAARARRIGHSWVQLALALALAVGLAAVQLLPTAEYLLASQRAQEVGYEHALTYSFWPWRFLTLLAPQLFGDPATGDYWGYGNYWEDAVYIGLLPFLLAAGAGINAFFQREDASRYSAAAGERRGLARFLVVLALVVFWLALGKHTPLFPWLYQHVPTFDLFQGPARWSILAVFALALLGGLGLEGWHRPTGRALYWTRLGTAGALAITLGAGAAWLGMRSVSPSIIRATALAGLWSFATGLLALTAPHSPSLPLARWAWTWGVALLAAADLTLAGWGLNPGANLDLYRQPPVEMELARQQIGDGRIYLPAKAEYELKFGRFFSFASFEPRQAGVTWLDLRAARLPNLNMLEGLPSANNFDPLVPGRYARWLAVLEGASGEIQARFLNLMAVRVVEQLDVTRAGGLRFTARASLPRLRWVPCAQFAGSGEEALAWLSQAQWDPESTVIIEGQMAALAGALAPDGAACKPGALEELMPVVQDSQRLVVDLKASAPGFLVISDVWYPGWTARVNGQAAPVLPANYLFKAVPLPAGTQRVELAYRPVSFALGAVISLICWLGLNLRIRIPGKSEVR